MKNRHEVLVSIHMKELSVKQKSIKTYKKKTNSKTSLNNLETSKPDFLRNSIADSSVKSCCFMGDRKSVV